MNKLWQVVGALALLGSGPAVAAPASGTVSEGDLAAITKAVNDAYASISGPIGQKRDFAHMRSLFAPNALLRVIEPKGLRGGTLEDYIRDAGPFLEKDGFTERELAHRVEVYGNLAQVWSAYEGKTAAGSWNTRGINSIQLVKMNGRWLIASILWQQETPQLPLPADLDPGK